MKTDTFGFGAIVDSVAQMLTEVYGDLAPPWDTAPGVYNHHDVVARDRFRRDLPTLDDKFHEYLKYENILDEFEGAGGPYVLFNFAGEVRADAMQEISRSTQILPGQSHHTVTTASRHYGRERRLLDAQRFRSRQGLDDVHGARRRAFGFR